MTNLRIHSEVLSSFRDGNAAAFEIIYNLYHYTIYGFAYYYLGNQQDAEDIASETFVKLWNLRNNFQTMENILAFLRITTRNACLDFLKAKKRNVERTSELIYMQEQDYIESFNDFDIKGEVLRYVHREIENLPKKSRRVMQLALNGYKNAEIARQLNVCIQTVMNQKTSALKSIRVAILAKKLMLLLLLLNTKDNSGQC